MATETLVALSPDHDTYGRHAAEVGESGGWTETTKTFDGLRAVQFHYWDEQDLTAARGRLLHACVVATDGINPACAERPHMIHFIRRHRLYRYDHGMKLATDVVGNI